MKSVNDDEIEIDLRDVFAELLIHWKAILLAVILCAEIAFGYGDFFTVPQYASTAKLYVLTKSTSITSLADIQTGANLTHDYLIVVTGRPVLEQVISNLKLTESYEELEKKIDVNNPQDTRILEITVKDQDPKHAKVIADEVADVSAAYIAEKMDQDPPNVIQKGYTDGDPVSMSLKKYTAIGGAVGLFLAVAVIIISYIFNDTIMNPEDMEKKVGINVLASLPIDGKEE